MRKQKSQTSTSTEHIDDIVEETTSSSDSSSETKKMVEEGEDMAAEKTIREHNAPPVDQQPLCIAAPTLTVPFELKSGLIHLLPKFRGLPNEDPYKHLKQLHVVCSSMKPQDVRTEQVKLRAFPFSLEDAAKDWLFYLPLGSITTWEAMMKQFLNKYFPASRAIAIRWDICGIKQKPTETLHDYWEHFKRLCATCPQHGVSEQGLIHYFYQGLHATERGMLDAASGGSIVDKTPTEAREIISTMAATSQDFGDSQDMPRIVNEASISSIESKLNQLTNMHGEVGTANEPNSHNVSKLESQGKLPSQTETNPKHNVCAITLRSGKELKNAPAKLRRGHALEDDAGRPFLSTSRTKIDVHGGTFSMEFDGNVVKFNTMRYPNLVSSVCKIDIVDPVLQETLELHQQDKAIEMLSEDVNLNHIEKPKVNSSNDEKVLHKLEILNSAFDNSSISDLSHSDTKSLSYVRQEPKFELNPPLEHLKFAYLRDEPYYSDKIYKDKTRGFYDQEIFRQQFVLGQKVFLDDLELSLFSSKFQSKWTNAFVITDVYSHDVVEIKSLHTGQIFKVNGNRLKPFYEGFKNATVEEVDLVESHLKLGSSQSPT
ncbi:hypothetical protein G2W53_017695 [Senna tora]|uniref:Retrotransposon gag domain-containing protein n=1 Tax=Senna tora TaxID=362788 RepID=A0A834TTK8_9FABA|nr:hypothetical protein G2W53_017695 [Senna tora]